MSPNAIQPTAAVEEFRSRAISWLDAFIARYNAQLFLLFIGLSLIPVIWFDYLPTSDGPGHVFNSKLLVDYYLRESPLAHEYFQPNPAPVPNWFGHVFMAVAMCVLSPLRAERVLIAGYIALLPLAFRYALRSVSRLSVGLEFLIFPFLYNSHLHWGFYNFCYSLVFYLFGLGFWIRHSSQISWRRLGQFIFLILLTYFSHPIGLFELFIAASFLFAWGLLRGGEGTFMRNLRDAGLRLRASREGFTYLIGGFLPALALYGVFWASRIKNSSNTLEWPTFRYASSTLLKLDPLKSFVKGERYCSIGISIFLMATLLFFVLGALRKKGCVQESRYLLLAVLCATLPFVSPVTASSGTMITPRLVYFPVFVFLLWLAVWARGKSLRRVFLSVGVISALVLHVLRWPIYSHYDLRMKQFVSVSQYVESGKTLLFLTFRDPFPQNLDPVTGEANLSGAAGGYVAALKGLVYLDNYEGATNHFPFVFRSNRDPFKYLFQPSKPRASSPSQRAVDLSGYERTTGQHIDYVLLWGLDTTEGRAEYQKGLVPQLQTFYEEVDNVPQQQAMKLYRRR